ncbi:YxlC family protein [Paenibacillus periandrae]|uniref:YxlC family protein n=1 Tax=Paenibacillus periandrae TaxID=1761741 RepID=UPI001F092886|nr:YxlC family protein [Paenibacillus periandrae]
MKKSKTDEQFDVDEGKLTAALHEGWDRLDNYIQASTPELDWFQQQIQLRQAANRKRMVLELGLFVIIAIVLLSVFISLTLWTPAIFLIIQLISVLIVPFVLVSLLRKRVEA